jgi:hypothetical protein
MRKLSFSFLLFFVLSTLTYAQKVHIKGRIIDSQSKEGLPGCNVLIENTTLGQSSNIDGLYQFSNIAFKEFTLIFRYVGYETTTRLIKVQNEDSIKVDVELKPLENSLTEIEVKSKRDKKWEKQLKTFKNTFFGFSDFAGKCQIENPWILDFTEDGDVFSASSKQTLKVINNALGYLMYFDINEYKVEKDTYKIGTRVSYQEMTAPNKLKLEEWLRNRKEAYKKSFGYFAKTAARGQLQSQGYMLFAEKPGASPVRTDNFEAEINKSILEYKSTDMVSAGRTPDTKKIYIRPNLEIHNQNSKSEVKVYQDRDYGVSWVQVRGNYVYLDSKLNILNYADIVTSGDMSYLKASGLLPLDYDESINVNDAYFVKFDKPSFAETVHIHTDRNSYYSGETIWYKAYMNYSSFKATDTTSKILHFQLIDANKQLIKQQKLEIDNGFSYGQLELALDLKPGLYTIRAFTQYMLNFTKPLFQKNILIMPHTEQLRFDPSTEEEVIDALNVIFTPSSGGLKVNIKDKSGKALSANASVSIVNPSFDIPLSVNLIKNLAIPKEKLPESVKYKMQKGLSLEGILLNKNKEPLKADFSVFTSNFMDAREESSNITGKFLLNDLHIYGEEADLFFKIKGKKNQEAIVTVLPVKDINPEIQIPENQFQTMPVAYIFKTEQAEKSMEKVNAGREVKQIYGRPDYVITEKELIKTNGSQGIINSITNKVPSCRHTNLGFIIRGGASTARGTVSALVLIDGVPNNNYQNLDPNNILKIEVVSRIAPMYGDQGKNGIVSFILKSEMSQEEDPKNKQIKVAVSGYSVPNPFEPSRLLEKTKAKPLTYFWNPELISNEQGELLIEDKDFPKPYRLSIEGITINNIPFRREILIKQ